MIERQDAPAAGEMRCYIGEGKLVAGASGGLVFRASEPGPTAEGVQVPHHPALQQRSANGGGEAALKLGRKGTSRMAVMLSRDLHDLVRCRLAGRASGWQAVEHTIARGCGRDRGDPNADSFRLGRRQCLRR